MRILALGDSYTIGEGVGERDRWPSLLAERLAAGGAPVEELRIIAATGWTTDELRSAIDASGIESGWDLVTLLVGVNDQYRGRAIDEFMDGYRGLLDLATSLAEKGGRTVAISIPDWGVTPFAVEKDRDPSRVAIEIDAYNEAARRECERRGIPFVEVTEISRRAASDRALLVSDGLHPSRAMYESWIVPVMDAVRTPPSAG